MNKQKRWYGWKDNNFNNHQSNTTTSRRALRPSKAHWMFCSGKVCPDWSPLVDSMTACPWLVMTVCECQWMAVCAYLISATYSWRSKVVNIDWSWSIMVIQKIHLRKFRSQTADIWRVLSQPGSQRDARCSLVLFCSSVKCWAQEMLHLQQLYINILLNRWFSRESGEEQVLTVDLFGVLGKANSATRWAPWNLPKLVFILGEFLVDWWL